MTEVRERLLPTKEAEVTTVHLPTGLPSHQQHLKNIMSKSYVILDTDEVSSVDFSQVFETSANTLRYNVANTQTFVKYDGSKPRFLYGKDTYTHSAILAVLATDAWTPEEPPV